MRISTPLALSLLPILSTVTVAFPHVVETKRSPSVATLPMSRRQRSPRELSADFNVGDREERKQRREGRPGTATAPLVNSLNGTLWYATISVGTPPVDFTVDIDTGSSDTFIPALGCPGMCVGHKMWDPSQSSTSVNTTAQYLLSFGDGSATSGFIFKDTVSIAGLTATQQAIGASSAYFGGRFGAFSTDSFQSDGLIGLAFPSLSEFKMSPIFQTLIAQGTVHDHVFAMRVTPDGGVLNLGGIDHDLADGPITWVPLTEAAFWQINMDGVKMNGQTILATQSVIVDSGTDTIVLDDDSTAAFYALIPGSERRQDLDFFFDGSGVWTVPCDGVPSVSLTFGGRDFVMAPWTIIAFPLDDGSNDCAGAFMSGGPGITPWVIGDSFLLNVYTIFDVDNTRVGFAVGA